MKKQKPMRRGAGVLLPVSSLPSPYGIGAFGKEAYDFIDFLYDAGQKYWQILPIGPTSCGDSPYQSFSAFAGNPYFIDLDSLIEEGLLTKNEVRAYSWGDDPAKVDYSLLYENRFPVLELAFSRADLKNDGDYSNFCNENSFWLTDYSLFMAIKSYLGGIPWQSWPKDIRMANSKAINEYMTKLKEQIDFHKICQYYFFKQWINLKKYANDNEIEIIGDIPIYVAMDSADVWSNPHLFQLDKQRKPLKVAGVPPDMFSKTGQLWGNPLYDWKIMEQDNFSWWKARAAFSVKLYDIVRIDHFIGIAHYYSIPAGDETAANGVWITGPGIMLLEAISGVIGGAKRVIAENLGAVTPAVTKILTSAGYPGMKLMQFGFDSSGTNENLPGFFKKNLAVYGGTHDNETLAGFFAHQKRKHLRFAREYLGVKKNSEIAYGVIRAAFASVADAVIFQMQDYLGLTNEARMNTPSTIGGNWRWRLKRKQFDKGLADRMKRLTKIYGR